MVGAVMEGQQWNRQPKYNCLLDMRRMCHFLSRIAVSQHCSMSRWPLRALRLAPIDLQVDEWILAFGELLKEHCGSDPDKPLEVQEVSGGSVAHLHYTPPS